MSFRHRLDHLVLVLLMPLPLRHLLLLPLPMHALSLLAHFSLLAPLNSNCSSN